jgi:hypothetical protein
MEGAGLQIDQVGDFGVRIRSPTGNHRILPVSVSAVGASFQVTVDNDVGQPPYRIENRCGRPPTCFTLLSVSLHHRG